MKRRTKAQPSLLPFVRIIRGAIPDPVMTLDNKLPCWMLRCYVTPQHCVWISTGVLLRDKLDVVVKTPLGCYEIEAGFHRGDQWLGLSQVAWPLVAFIDRGDGQATLPNGHVVPLVAADHDQLNLHPQQWKDDPDELPHLTGR